MNVNLHEALEEIRQWIRDNEATSPYTKEGCRVSMANIPSERVVLDVDLAFPTGRARTNQCDFVLFYIDTAQNNLVGVPMELKRGDVDASEAVAQLQEGARIVDNCTPDNVQMNLVLVLVHGGSMHRSQRNRLRTSRIRFRGAEFPINTARCGHQGNLAQALAKSIKR
ncbi:hypothetical protein F4009_13740 [Candidatus Poribacteria bacterium]|nr:hypothetical protein [Candidatus Poribacteria bacterium]MYH82260.1 hypothetical protein [Candidatus Poribacteria bacterium]MYK95036.1 hypothetical protein [Candidatus Poribacteria bacterium]